MGKRLIGSVGLKPGTDTGFDLDTKGQIHGYTNTQFALPVGDDNQILSSLASEASGLKWITSSAGGSLEVLYDSGTLTTEASDTYTPSEGTLIFPTYTGLMIVAEITCSGNPRVDLILDGVTTGTDHYSTGGTIAADGARTDYADSGVAYCPLISDTTTGSSNKNLVAKMDLFFSTETSAMLGWVWAVNRDDLKSEERMVDYYSVLVDPNTIASVGIAVSTGTFTGRWFVYGYKA